MGGYSPPINGKSLCPKSLAERGGTPSPLNGKNPLKRFWKRSLLWQNYGVKDDMLWCQSKTNMICWIQFWSGTDVVQFEKMVRYWMHSENVELTFWMSQFLKFIFQFLKIFSVVFDRNWLAEAGPDVELTRLQVIIFYLFLLFWNACGNFFYKSISTILTAACNRQRVSTDFDWYVHYRWRRMWSS